MAKKQISLDGDEPRDGSAHTATVGQDAPAVQAPAAETKHAGPAPLTTVQCQRCRVDCVPAPNRPGFVACPQCGWRHKPLVQVRAMAARRRAAIAAAGRSAR